MPLTPRIFFTLSTVLHVSSNPPSWDARARFHTGPKFGAIDVEISSSHIGSSVSSETALQQKSTLRIYFFSAWVAHNVVVTFCCKDRGPVFTIQDSLGGHEIHVVYTDLGPLWVHVGMTKDRVAMMDMSDVEVVQDEFAQPARMDIPGFFPLLSTTKGGIVLLCDIAQVATNVHDFVARMRWEQKRSVSLRTVKVSSSYSYVPPLHP